MPFTEQDKTVLSDIVEAFTIAIAEVCETYEHQNKLTSQALSAELTLRSDEFPTDQRGKMKRAIFQNIIKVLEGHPYPSGSLFEMQDQASRKVA
jgi:hypothetical protein